MKSTQKRKETRLFRYSRALGNVRGYCLYFLEQLGFRFPVRLRFGGERFKIRLRSSDIDVLYTVFVRQDYRMKFETAPAVIVDVGAYTGFSSVYFAKQFPNAKIIALEPMPENFSLLTENTSCYTNIIPVQRALWFKETQVEFVNRNTGDWGHTINSGLKSTFPISACVDAVSMGRLMADFNLDRIDLLKMDIEGAEKEVFEHGYPWIEKIDTIAVELHERIKDGCEFAFDAATTDFPFKRQNTMTVFKSRRHPI